MTTGRVTMVGAFPYQPPVLVSGCWDFKNGSMFLKYAFKTCKVLGVCDFQSTAQDLLVYGFFFDSDDRTTLNETCLALHW